MLRLNFKLILICLSVALSSCQSIEEPKPKIIKPIRIEPIIKEGSIVRKDKGLGIINIAIEQVKLNHLQNAQNILLNYLKTHDDNRVRLNVALIHMQKEQYPEAKSLLKSIREIDINNAIVLEHLAIIARENGQFKEAKKLYVQALKNSDRPSIHLNYGILLDLYSNELNAALHHYKIYQDSGFATQDGIEIDQWIADLNARIKRAN